MSLPITTLYALPLVVIFFPLWIAVSSIRSELKCSIGDNGDKKLLLSSAVMATSSNGYRSRWC